MGPKSLPRPLQTVSSAIRDVSIAPRARAKRTHACSAPPAGATHSQRRPQNLPANHAPWGNTHLFQAALTAPRAPLASSPLKTAPLPVSSAIRVIGATKARTLPSRSQANARRKPTVRGEAPRRASVSKRRPRPAGSGVSQIAPDPAKSAPPVPPTTSQMAKRCASCAHQEVFRRQDPVPARRARKTRSTETSEALSQVRASPAS